MPPRFAYWTILVGGLPTAFRAAERDEIEPTFKRLQHKHPDAEMRWFARGKLWASPQEATDALTRQKAEGTRRNDGFGERRDRSWRPGGSHRDPRQPYKDAKKRENQKRRERRFEFKRDKPTSQNSEFRIQKPQEQRPKWTRPPGEDRRPKTGDWRQPKAGDRRPPKTEDRRPKTWEQRPQWKGSRPQAPGSRPREERPKWSPESRDQRPPKTEDRRPKTWEQRPQWKGSKPHATGSRPDEERPKWKRPPGDGKPEGEKPWKPRPRPGAWGPKPGARKGPRGPR